MPFERRAFESVLKTIPPSELHFDLIFVTAQLDESTAPLAEGATALCLFVRDRVEVSVLRQLRAHGVKLLALRYEGTPAFDAHAAKELGFRIARVAPPTWRSVAEYAVSLILSLGRRVHIAANRVRDGNLSLQHGLVGEDMEDRVIGVVGTGEVGCRVVEILRGFDTTVLAFDIIENPRVNAAGATYVTWEVLLAKSDVLTLHAPRVPGTRNMINEHSLSHCKEGVQIVNTSSATLIDRKALVSALRMGRVGAVGMDIFESDLKLFVQDENRHSLDPDFEILKTIPNVIITGHQSSLTENSLKDVAKLAVQCLNQFHVDSEER